ncbi:MAG: hypothetical protein AAGA01_17750 [Cyanobacteria bacterium P01_E01_bin.43]
MRESIKTALSQCHCRHGYSGLDGALSGGIVTQSDMAWGLSLGQRLVGADLFPIGTMAMTLTGDQRA